MRVAVRALDIAKVASNAFGGAPRIERYWAASKQASIDVLACSDSLEEGIWSLATVGLSDAPIVIDGKELNVRAELVAASSSEPSNLAACLATAALWVIERGWPVAPGVIFDGVLPRHSASSTLEHFLFLPQFLWDDLRPIKQEAWTVAWLLAMPISDAERSFAYAHGVPALEALFEQVQVDVFDLDRQSIV